MTGKEALENIKNSQHHREEKNWIIVTPLQNTEEYKTINKEIDELTKYKKAFEILNLNITLICKEDEYLCNKKYYLLSDTYTEIEKEEAELLEELMKDE